MKEISLRWNVVLAVIYVFLVACSLYFMFEVAAHDAFCGLPAITLSLPWSYFMFLIVEAVIPSAFKSIVSGTIIIILGALINTLLLLYGFSWTNALFKKKTKS